MYNYLSVFLDGVQLIASLLDVLGKVFRPETSILLAAAIIGNEESSARFRPRVERSKQRRFVLMLMMQTITQTNQQTNTHTNKETKKETKEVTL